MTTPTPQRLSPIQQFARHLQARRKSMGYSQRELATRVGTSQAMIARIEAGSANPSLSTLERVMSALDLEVNIRFTNRPR